MEERKVLQLALTKSKKLNSLCFALPLKEIWMMADTGIATECACCHDCPFRLLSLSAGLPQSQPFWSTATNSHEAEHSTSMPKLTFTCGRVRNLTVDILSIICLA